MTEGRDGRGSHPAAAPGKLPRRRWQSPTDEGVESNARLTGATARQWGLAVSLVVGVVLGLLLLGPAAHYHHI